MGGMPMAGGGATGGMSTSGGSTKKPPSSAGSKLDNTNPIKAAAAGAKFLVKLFKDSAF